MIQIRTLTVTCPGLALAPKRPGRLRTLCFALPQPLPVLLLPLKLLLMVPNAPASLGRLLPSPAIVRPPLLASLVIIHKFDGRPTALISYLHSSPSPPSCLFLPFPSLAAPPLPTLFMKSHSTPVGGVLILLHCIVTLSPIECLPMPGSDSPPFHLCLLLITMAPTLVRPCSCGHPVGG